MALGIEEPAVEGRELSAVVKEFATTTASSQRSLFSSLERCVRGLLLPRLDSANGLSLSLSGNPLLVSYPVAFERRIQPIANRLRPRVPLPGENIAHVFAPKGL